MKWSFGDLPFGYRLSLAISAILALMIGVTALSLTGSSQPRAQLSNLIGESNSLLLTIAEMRQDLLSEEVMARRLSSANSFEDAKAIMHELNATQAKFEKRLGLFKAPPQADPAGSLVADLWRHQKAAHEGIQAADALVAAFNPVKAADVLSKDVAPSQMESLRALDRLIELHSREIGVRVDALDRAAVRTDRATVGICALAVLIATWIASRLTRSITQPLRDAVAYADALGNGELEAKQPPCHRDEVGALISMMGNMAGRLTEMHRRLERQSNEDALTGAYNRRHFNRTMQLEHGRALRLCDGVNDVPEGGHLALLMLDVDHFKRYNDRFGHPAGDACLQAVVAAIRTAILRPTDVVARYGGEEFAVILPGCGLDGAALVADRVREAVMAAKIDSGEAESPWVTVSVGVAVCEDPREVSVERLVAATDEQLYQSKRNGRNRVTCCRLPSAVERRAGEQSLQADGLVAVE